MGLMGEFLFELYNFRTFYFQLSECDLMESPPFFCLQFQPIIFESDEPVHSFVVFFLNEAARFLRLLLNFASITTRSQFLQLLLQLIDPFLFFIQTSQCAFVERVGWVARWLLALRFGCGFLVLRSIGKIPVAGMVQIGSRIPLIFVVPGLFVGLDVTRIGTLVSMMTVVVGSLQTAVTVHSPLIFIIKVESSIGTYIITTRGPSV